MDEKELTKIDGWLEQLAMELVFCQPGSDKGQFPIRDIVSSIRDKVAGNSEYAALHAIAAIATENIENVMMSGKPFSVDDISKLGKSLEEMKVARNTPGAPVPSGVAVPASTAPVVASAHDDEDSSGAPLSPALMADAPEEIPLIMNLDDDAEMLKEFITESYEHLGNVEQGILVLEENPNDADTLNSAFRAFHSFKGGSGFLNLIPINKLAHELESLLDLARQNKMPITHEVIELILKGGDTLREFVTEMEGQVSGRKPHKPFIIPTFNLIQQVKDCIARVGSGEVAAETSAPAPVPQQAVEAPPVAAPAPQVTVAASVSAPVESVPESKVVPIAKPPVAAPAQTATKPVATAVTQSGASSQAASVKIDTFKLDNLVDLVGELVIAQSQVAQDNDLKSIATLRLTRNIAQMGRITKELQKTAMSLRMVPIRATFQKMNRLVRDLAAREHKEVMLALSGEDTELDRTIVEEISDPLIHMVRNSVDHGIESPAVRKENGKPSFGTINLRAFHQGGNIVIEIEDDGGGLNKEKILKKAEEKGLVSQDETLTDQEIFALIFAPGFSTADKVTDISGRGVGMDVVRKNIEKLRGKIEIQSTLGKGTTFSIYLPLTLAIIEGLIILVGDQKYILPTLSVRESFRPTADMITSVHERGEMVNVRGHLLPLVRLHELFDLKPSSHDPSKCIVIVIESGHDCRCLLVDDLIGKQEIVIKSLSEQFKKNKALAGASILGDGTVGLILDVSTLVHTERLNNSIAA